MSTIKLLLTENSSPLPLPLYCCACYYSKYHQKNEQKKGMDMNKILFFGLLFVMILVVSCAQEASTDTNDVAGGTALVGQAVGRPRQATCTDSDGGKNYEIKGVVRTSLSSLPLSDSCNGRNLREYYCDGTRAKSEQVTCPVRCLNGACITGWNQCTGPVPVDATLCAGDDQGLSNSIPRTLVSSCGDNRCEYTCNEGMVLEN